MVTWREITLGGALAGALGLLGSVPWVATADDVVAAGDSWAELGADELGQIFSLNGHPEITVYNGGIGGTTADLWAAEPWYLPSLVALNPEAEWVWLSLGGNDVFYYSSSGQSELAAEAIDADLRTVLDALFDSWPLMKVVMFGYDYPNFEQSAECMAQAMVYFPGMLTPDINSMLLEDIGLVQLGIAQDYPNVTYVPLWGTLQLAGDVPNAPNPLYPSPAQFMADCIHANDEGYRLIMQELYEGYFQPQLESAPTCRLERSTPTSVLGAGACLLTLTPAGLYLRRRGRKYGEKGR